MSQASHAVQLNQETTNAFSVKDIYKGLSQMTGFHMDVEKKPHIKQSLVQGKNKHKKPKIMYLVQENEMETYMDEFEEAEEKTKPTAANNQEAEALV